MKKLAYLIALVFVLSGCSRQSSSTEIETELSDEQIKTQITTLLSNDEQKLSDNKAFIYQEDGLSSGNSGQLELDATKVPYEFSFIIDNNNSYTYTSESTEVRNVDTSNINNGATHDQIVRESPSREDIDSLINNNILMCESLITEYDQENYQVSFENNTYIVSDTRDYFGAPTCSLSDAKLIINYNEGQQTTLTFQHEEKSK